MRVLMTLLPATGSLHPLLPLADRLRQRGHTVAFATAEPFRADVERHGFLFFGCGTDWHVSDPRYIELLCKAAGGLEFPALTGQERFAWVTDRLFIGGAARRMLPDVLAVARHWSAELVVRESLEFSGCVAAEVLGIPHASVAAAADSALDQRERLAVPLGTLRRDVDLPSDVDGRMPYRYLHLCFAPASFHGPDALLPSTARFFRHEPAPRPGELPPAWPELPPGPMVLASLGTVFHRTAGLAESIVEAVRDEPVNLVLALGYDQDPSRLGPQPPNVRVAPWLPLDRLLPSAAVLLTHAGFNSVKEAMAFGIPMVMVPIAGDQHYAAARGEALGVAEVVPPDERSPSRIRHAVRRVVQNPSYRERASDLRRQIENLSPLDDAVPLLERLATGADRLAS